MMTDWKVYTGSDVDVSNIEGSQYGFIVKYSDSSVSNIFTSILDGIIRNRPDIIHYLICDPHPLADMICQQARTGQPVWVKYRLEWDRRSDTIETDCTDKPDWHIPGAEYSFTPFKGEV